MVNIMPYLNMNRTIDYSEGRAEHHATFFYFPIMPHLVKLLMFYAIKLQFILTNNTERVAGANWIRSA